MSAARPGNLRFGKDLFSRTWRAACPIEGDVAMVRKEATVDATFPLLAAGGTHVVGMAGADVGRNREEMRRQRL